MQVELLSDATEFTRRAEGAVAADPVSTSVIAGMLAVFGTAPAPPHRARCGWRCWTTEMSSVLPCTPRRTRLSCRGCPAGRSRSGPGTAA